ncbi:MAG TPA: sigma 54-interacting transcriptional regulator [Polyangiaceae bacterium]|nr:sigma 54-interacting transcriptional regulator [Polyangiaceae bacterium]
MAKALLLPPRYEPLAPLGKGGGGEVWCVRDRITGRTVALKALGEGADEREVMALVREAAALSGVEGLGVPRVLRFGRLPNSERAYLVRELVEGTSLAELIGKGGDPRALLSAIGQAADKLTLLHRALLLHGDLKPANIIVGEDGRATLVDLGLAAAWREGGVKPAGLTPKYAAPELFEGAPLTVRAEVFALGVTIGEALRAGRDRLDAETVSALEQVVAKATAEDPGARYPSADELASALRTAAHLTHDRGASGDGAGAAEGARDRAAMVWPVVGLEATAGRLLAHIAAIRPGSGIVVTGPRGSGRTTLMRRIAWSLGVEGQAVAWIEAASGPEDGSSGEEAFALRAIGIELGAHGENDAVIALVDDAERLPEGALRRLEEVRERGGKLVLSTGAENPSLAMPGPTLEVFEIPPLDSGSAAELLRRTIPSLSDAVIAHVVAKAGHWPGRIRDIVTTIAAAPVVEPADVDRLLELARSKSALGGSVRPSRSPPSRPPPTPPHEELNRLLDRGHFDEAAEALRRFEGDQSPPLAIARARLFTNRGEAARALAELALVRDEVLASDRVELAAGWLLHAARASLRAGEYGDAERLSREVSVRLKLHELEGDDSDVTLSEGIEQEERAMLDLSPEVRLIAADAMAVRGLSQSFASRHRDAKRSLVRAVRFARAIGEPRILSVTLGSLAFALQRDNHLSDAKIAYEEALAAAERAGDAGSVATIRLNLASIAQTQADPGGAIGHLEAAVDMGRRSGRVATLRQALLNLAHLDLYLGRVARARVSLDALQEQRGDLPPQQLAQLLALEAEHAAQSGDLAGAERLCEECARAYEAMGRSIDAAEALLERVLFGAAGPAPDPALLERELERAERTLAGTTAHKALFMLARGRVAALQGAEAEARTALGEALEAARASGQRDLVWRALEARAELAREAGQALKARRDREEALLVLEEIASRLPRDLREVYWNDPRRKAVRSSGLLDRMGGPTVTIGIPSEDRLARVLEINRAIAGEVDLPRLLEKVTDHAIALLRAERGFVILRSGYGARSAPSVRAASEPPAFAPPDPDAPPDLSIYASRDQAGDDPHASFSRSIAERVITSGEPIVTSSAKDDARMSDYVSVHQLMLQSIACVPIRARNGRVIGALYLETRLRPTASFGDDLPTIVALADQVAIAIETARLLGENERRARELERANADLLEAQKKLEELLGHRTEQLAATRRDLKSARAVLRGHFGYEGLCGTSEAMRRVYALIDRVKETDVPVLITGESGTGKEMVARAIHNAGVRARKPFLGINCGAIPEHLLESELFGHVRGAFTGADRERKGLLREATEGTLLLDEIGEMPHKMQAGLLRVLQEKVVRPVGGAREEPVSTRIIAATHRELERMVQEGTFREDLYYRLHVIEIRVPPLRERIEDIPLLIDHFLGIFAARYGRERRSVSRAALKRLTAYSWPGNVRQLENVLLNAWVLSDRPELEEFELPDTTYRAPAAAAAPDEPSRRPVQTSLDAHKASERERILSALSSCNWNRVKAAQIVGLPRRTFYRRLKEYGIQ